MREVFPKFVEDYLIKDKKIFVLLGDIGVHSFRNVFNNFKKNILNIGILEQTMVGFSAGLAIEGKIPFVHTIAPFIVNRAYEQIKVDLCYQNLNVNLVSVGASLDYAALGSTHHCPEDVAILSKLPNIKIYCPGNAVEFYNLLKNYSLPGPKYFRITGSSHKLKLNIKNNAAILKKGKKGTIVVVGNALRFIDEYYQELQQQFYQSEMNSFEYLDPESFKETIQAAFVNILLAEYYLEYTYKFLKEYLQLP